MEGQNMSMCDEEIRRLESELEDCNADMELYKKKSDNIIKFLNDLYEALDEHYTEIYQNHNYLQVVRAETKLKLMTKIIDEVEKI